MFEFDGINYKLYFTEGVIEAIETTLGRSLMNTLYQNNAMLPLRDLKTIFSMSLCETATGKRPSQNTAMKIYDGVKEQLGYTELCGMIVQAFEHDCPFFFQMN